MKGNPRFAAIRKKLSARNIFGGEESPLGSNQDKRMRHIAMISEKF